MFKKLGEILRVIRQDMEDLNWMSRDEKKHCLKSTFTGLVLIEISNKLDIIEEKIRELDYLTMRLSKIKYREKSAVGMTCYMQLKPQKENEGTENYI